MPDPSVLTARGEQLRSTLPVILRDSPDYLALIHPFAMEMDRLDAAKESVRSQFFPASADMLLKAWEAQLGLPIEPPDLTLAQRRNLVFAYLRRQAGTPEGEVWVALVAALVGPGFTYEEHDVDNVDSPPAYTVRVTVPFAPSSGNFRRIEALLREITPAHLDLIVQFSGGFVLDESELDQEGLG